jgi:hypothetical protein
MQTDIIGRLSSDVPLPPDESTISRGVINHKRAFDARAYRLESFTTLLITCVSQSRHPYQLPSPQPLKAPRSWKSTHHGNPRSQPILPPL